MIRRIAIASIALVMLSACTPSKQYEGSKSEGVFFSVPNSWNKVDGAALAKEESKSANQNDIDRITQWLVIKLDSQSLKILPLVMYSCCSRPPNQCFM
jgi:hypothetical protein